MLKEYRYENTSPEKGETLDRPASWKIGFENGAKSGLTDYAYDLWGNMVSQQYSFQKVGSGREKCRYEYDSRQNWVVKISDFYDTGNYHSQALAKREIVYY